MSTDFSRARLRGPVLALDLGGTNARAAVVAPDGELTVRHAGSTPMAAGMTAVIDYCLELLRKVRAEHLAAGGAEPIAVGIAAPGPLDPRTGTLIDPPNLRGDLVGLSVGTDHRRCAGPALGDGQGHQRQHPRRARLRRR